MEKLKTIVPYQLTKHYVKNNYEFVIFLTCVVTINVALFISRAVQYYYKGKNTYVIFARACGKFSNGCKRKYSWKLYAVCALIAATIRPFIVVHIHLDNYVQNKSLFWNFWFILLNLRIIYFAKTRCWCYLLCSLSVTYCD